jgi:hypothetical protein
MTAFSCIGSGMASAYDQWKKRERSHIIEDSAGFHMAGLQVVENGALSAGSITSFPLSIVDLTEDICHLRGVHPFMLSHGVLSTTQSFFSWASTVLFSLYYLLTLVRCFIEWSFWIRGSEKRESLLKEENPLKKLKDELSIRLQSLNQRFSEVEYKKLALDAGEKWMSRVIKEAQARGQKIQIKDKRDAFRKYIESDSTLIDSIIGNLDVGPFKMSTEGKMIAFGRFLAARNECARFEAECTRSLGAKAIDMIKNEDINGFKMEIQSKQSIKFALKVTVAVLGFLSLVVVSVFSAGLPLIIVCLVTAVASFVALITEDWSAFKNHLQNGEFRKRDRIFIYFTLALSIVSLAALITLAVLSGGIIPLIAGAVLTAAWVAMNIKSTYALWKFDHRPWEVQKEVSIDVFERFLKTKPTEDQIKNVYDRLRAQDRAVLEQGRLDEPLLEKVEKLRQERLKILQSQWESLFETIEYIVGQ